MHNPTELSLIVMQQGANEYCKQKLGNYFTTKFSKILGRYTAYFSCQLADNYIEQYNLPDEEKKCIENSGLKFVSSKCLELNKKNVDIINSIELQVIDEKKYIEFDFIYTVRTKFYNEIKKFEEIAEEIAQDNKINSEIKRNIKICNNYNFEKKSNDFVQCIITLMKDKRN